jgi:hypothetical protein
MPFSWQNALLFKHLGIDEKTVVISKVRLQGMDCPSIIKARTLRSIQHSLAKSPKLTGILLLAFPSGPDQVVKL